MTLQDAMQLIGRESVISWKISLLPRQPSSDLQSHLRRLQVFDLQTTEQAKTLLIDALFVEIVIGHPKLKIWKAAALNTDTLTGVVKNLMVPQKAYSDTPLLCVASEARRF